MQNAALEGSKKLAGDPVYKFYSALSLLFQGQIQGAIRQLEPLKVRATTKMAKQTLTIKIFSDIF